MNLVKLGSGLVLVVLAVWILASIATLAVTNDLFRGSDWQLAALASLGVVVVGLLVYVVLALPWRFRRQTTYW